MLKEIKERRSIRMFESRSLPRGRVEAILAAGIQAPSGKNRQPWEFIVLQGESKKTLTSLVRESASRAKELGIPTGSANNSAQIMDQAPVVVMVYNPLWQADADRTGTNRYMYSVDTQSVGAAIQNMLLQAQADGLGSLWVCDVFYADEEIGKYLQRTDELVAAVALGYAFEAPAARPRKTVDEVTRWLD